MKRLIPILAGLFAGIMPAFAQMLPDSTVQVVAYWELGDKQKYQVETAKYRIAQGDTTVVEKSAEIFEFEVVAADEEKGYRVKVTSLETQYSDPAMRPLKRRSRNCAALTHIISKQVPMANSCASCPSRVWRSSRRRWPRPFGKP